MFRIFDRTEGSQVGVNRRELLRVGGLSAMGLSLPMLLDLQARASNPLRGKTFGQAKNVIFLWLQGGPPQHETFDPKPDAPVDIRGEFKPIQTNVPGILISELLPRIAGICDKLAIVRSICTHTDLHDASGYWVLTGNKYQGAQSRQISPTDWPYLGSIVKLLKPSEKLPAYSSVWLPDVMRLNDNVQPAGQSAGWMGKRWEPERIICDPSGAEFKMEGLKLPADVPALRLNQREALLAQVERHFASVEKSGVLKDYQSHVQNAFGLLRGGRALDAFDISKESKKTRERYGRGKWGQSVLLARRLIEAGARLVHVNWPREGGDSAVDNPLWDTHAQNSDRVQDVLCPQLDVSLTALIQDLSERGLLDTTLVVVIGEFGRTPRINGAAGRDHWGHVFSYALAGAGIKSAQVYGSSDRDGAYPKTGRHEPQDLTATIFHLLGIPHDAIYPNIANTGRNIHISAGEPLDALLGEKPATDQRVAPTGNVALVPEYSEALLLNLGFDDTTGKSNLNAPEIVPLQLAGSGKRLKGWQGFPLGDLNKGFPLGVFLGRKAPGVGDRHAGIGVHQGGGKARIAQGEKAFLAQEIRNFRAGHYTLSILVAGAGASREQFDQVFNHFTCKLVIYRHAEPTKNPLMMKPAETLVFKPEFVEGHGIQRQKIVLAKLMDSRVPNANFSVGLGFGIAIVVEKTSAGVLEVAANTRAALLIDSVDLVFTPRDRNDDVQV
ncbi:MAG: DUF1501 domain-containing protein [Gemmataceae bacterium]|nr:DUF1501 domain-containing protein [Gemmataceae bacterium]